MSSCAKRVFLVMDPDELEATVRTAFEIAHSGRPGPVVIDVPKDVQNAPCTYTGKGSLDFRGYRRRTAALRSSRLVESKAVAFFRMLESSERPLIYAGGGVIHADAAGELRQFAAMYHVPVVSTLHALGAFDSTHPLSLHMLGMHGAAYANYAVEDCDFLIAIGTRFDDRVAGKAAAFAPNARNIAHLDVDAAEIGKVKMVTWSHVADAKQALLDLLDGGTRFTKDRSAWLAQIRNLKRDHPMNYDRESDLLQPHYVLECLNEITRGEAIISTGVGQHQMWAAQYLDYRRPRSWLTSGSMGTMGFGLPAAIGAQFACPDRLVIDVDGDGSIRMNLGELETVTNYDLPVKVLLFNNQGDGMVRQWQKLYFDDRFCATDKFLHKKDFIEAAKADGFEWTARVANKQEVRETLRAFVAHQGPAFLEVVIDPDAGVYPMVGPGDSYNQMITGPHIPSRDTTETRDHPETSDLF